MAFRDVYHMAAEFMPPDEINAMEGKLRPVLETMTKLGFLLRETEEMNVRLATQRAILLHENAQLRLQQRALACESKFLLIQEMKKL